LPAQLASEAERRDGRRLAERCDERVDDVGGDLDLTGDEQPLETRGEAKGRNFRAAEFGDHRVVTAAADERAAGAELVGRPANFEERARVVVQSANEPRIDRVRRAESVEILAQCFEVRNVARVERGMNGGRVPHHRVISLVLRVQNAKRIGGKAPLRVR
jgi:hypothetical protein